jgi:hypothetical protein
VQMLSVVAMEPAGAKGFETTRGAVAWRSKTVGCLDENVVRSLDERRERLLSENDDVLNTNMKRCFFSIQVKFHQTIQLSNNFSSHLLFPHPTIQQLFILSSISSSSYPTTFLPIYYFLIQLLIIPSINSSSNYPIYIFHPTIQQFFIPLHVSIQLHFSSNYPTISHPTIQRYFFPLI